MSSLHPCDSCRRHIRGDALACPFCATPARPRASEPVLLPRRPLTRSAILFAGAALLAPGCGSSSQETAPPAGSESTSSSGSDEAETATTQSDESSGATVAPAATPRRSAPEAADATEGGSPAPMYGTPN